MTKKTIKNLTARGIVLEKKGSCVICAGPVVEKRSLAPCGQQVRPVTYYCQDCGLAGNSVLWEDAWAAQQLKEKQKEVITFLEDVVRREYNPFEPDNQSIHYEKAFRMLEDLRRM